MTVLDTCAFWRKVLERQSSPAACVRTQQFVEIVVPIPYSYPYGDDCRMAFRKSFQSQEPKHGCAQMY